MSLISHNETPPYLYLRQVLRACPKAALTYMDLWRHRDEENIVNAYKKDIKNDYHIHSNKFNHDLLQLVSEGLASITETPNVLHIRLTAWYEDEEVYF